MSKMNDVDIQFKELKEKIEEIELVVSSFLGVLLAICQAEGDLAHDDGVVAANKTRIFGEIYEHLCGALGTETPEETEDSDDNVVPLFEDE